MKDKLMAQYISKSAVVAGIRNKVDSYKGNGIISISVIKQHCEDFIDSLDTLETKEVKEESVSNDMEEAAHLYVDTTIEYFDSEGNPCCYPAFIAGAQWQKEQDQSIIELAEDHAMLAGMEKMKQEIIDKAMVWLTSNMKWGVVSWDDKEECVRNFKKAMEK